ncbi:phosphorylase family protein [Streptomyces clavuligerus]|uniref:phosphorylase family protein n=1 Tax=Streptomyces clavuligerus TaxID=1901 RepID=UPI001F2B2949|nr:hypothetical protein [Streptomyces clavuligerus]
MTGLLAAEIDGNGARVRQERVWTTDALYRETATEVQQFTAEGAMAADMEAAGVLAVAHFRHIPAAAAFAIADSLVCRTPRHDSPKTHKGLVTLFDAAVRTLTRRLPSPAGADSRSPRARGLSPGTPPGLCSSNSLDRGPTSLFHSAPTQLTRNRVIRSE